MEYQLNTFKTLLTIGVGILLLLPKVLSAGMMHAKFSPFDFANSTGFSAASTVIQNRKTHSGSGDFGSNPPIIEGKVRAYGIMDNLMAQEYLNPEWQAWFKQKYAAMQVYSPWFDTETTWYKKGFEYKDMYAIYNCALPVADTTDLVSPYSDKSICASANAEHINLYEQAMDAELDPFEADWILKDSEGNPLYIPFADNYGRYLQLAADIRAPGFRQYWIEQMETALDQGDYKGIFVDDVNMDLNRAITNGKCRPADFAISPECAYTFNIDPVEWSAHLVSFVQEIRAAFVDKKIIHNSVWFHAQPGNQYVEAQIEVADIIVFERGINDSGIIGGDGFTSVTSFLNYNDTIHNAGRNVIHYIRLNDKISGGIIGHLQQLEYGLAGWLLISNGLDYFGGDNYNDPSNWWEGFEINLGNDLGERYELEDGVFQRDFENGIVLLNEPGSSLKELPVQIDLPGYYRTLHNECLDQLNLQPRTGKVLFAVESCTQDFGLQSN